MVVHQIQFTTQIKCITNKVDNAIASTNMSSIGENSVSSISNNDIDSIMEVGMSFVKEVGVDSSVEVGANNNLRNIVVYLDALSARAIDLAFSWFNVMTFPFLITGYSHSISVFSVVQVD